MRTTVAAFVTSDADLDHFTPVLHKFVERHHGSVVYLILADYHWQYSDDFRVRHLLSIGVTVRHVVGDLGLPRALVRAYFACAGSRRRVLRGAARLCRWVLGRGRLFGSPGYADRFFSTEPGRSVTVIVHNHHDRGSTALAERARAAGIASIVLPHAVDNFSNRMSDATRLRYPANRFLVAPADRIVTASVVGRDRFIAYGGARSDRIEVAGSARYCREWQTVLDRITPPAATRAPDGHFRILVLLAKPENNYFEAEVLRIIETVRRLPRVHVAVKWHTRTGGRRRVTADNVEFHERQTSSRALIQWADVTLFSATSAVVDGIVLDRPVLFLRRTINNTIMAERDIQSWAVDCRDDLCETILRLQAGLQSRTYSSDERDALLRNVVEPAGGEVLDLYVNAIQSVQAT